MLIIIMQFYNLCHEKIQLLASAQVQDLVILRSAVVIFYQQRYTVHDSTHLQQIKFDHYLKNKVVKPKQVQQELIAAVQPRGRLILLNPYKNQVLQILELPMLTQRNNAEWFFFHQYYVFQQSGMFSYRQEGYGSSIGLATFKQATKVSSFKHNILVKGASDTVQSAIDQFDNNCTLCIYEPEVKRALFHIQLLTLPSNEVYSKPVQLGQIFNLHKNIKILFTKLIDEQLFMICLKSGSIRSLFLFLNQSTSQIVFVIQSQSKFIRPFLSINNDPHNFLFESLQFNPPSFIMEALYSKQTPVIQTVGQIISGDVSVDYPGKRFYKWWPNQQNKNINVQLWSIYTKQKMYRHLLRENRIDRMFGDYVCVKVLRLLK